MAQIKVSKRIKAPVSEVWASWDDFANIYKFNPGVKHSELLATSKGGTGLGAQRQCDFTDGKNWVQEEIIGYQPEQQMKIVIFNGTIPLKTAQATIDFKKNGTDETDISFTMEFTPKFGVLGQMMLPLMKPQFKKLLGELIDGNDRFVTRGELSQAEASLAA